MLIQRRLSLSISLILCASMLFGNQSWCAVEPDEDSAESLLSLPYIQYVETEKAPNKVGTTIYNKN